MEVGPGILSTLTVSSSKQAEKFVLPGNGGSCCRRLLNRAPIGALSGHEALCKLTEAMPRYSAPEDDLKQGQSVFGCCHNRAAQKLKAGGPTHLKAIVVNPGMPGPVKEEPVLARQQDAAGVGMLAG